MLIAPINFVATFGLVPIFEWEPVESKHETAQAQPAQQMPATCEGMADDAGTPQDPAEPLRIEMRLVFKGFQFRPGFEIDTYPRPDWMAGFASGAPDPSDPSSKAEDRNKSADEAARARKAHLGVGRPDMNGPASAEPDSPNVTGSDDL